MTMIREGREAIMGILQSRESWFRHRAVSAHHGVHRSQLVEDCYLLS